MAMSPHEQTMIDALRLAEQSRKASGGFTPRVITNYVKVKDNGKKTWAGPRSFKITLWLKSWHYVDLLRQKADDGHLGSLTAYIQALVDSAVKHHSFRPEPRVKKVKAKPDVRGRRPSHMKAVAA